MIRKIGTLLLALIFLSGCGHQTEKCIICDTVIQDGEHVVSSNSIDFPHQYAIQGGVVCEKCQLQYTGYISGHCSRCLREFLENDPIYSDPDTIWYYMCDSCAAELYGGLQEQHLLKACKNCGNLMLPEYEYNHTGVCNSCAAYVYK